MSIYIEDMEIPEDGSCIQIIIDDDGKVYPSVEKCILKMDSIAKAVSVPPHGDLIDRNALLSVDRQIYDGDAAIGKKRYITFDEIEDAQTIIPAEREE